MKNQFHLSIEINRIERLDIEYLTHLTESFTQYLIQFIIGRQFSGSDPQVSVSV